MKKYIFLFFLFVIKIFAVDVETLVKELDIVPAKKASIQWERVFTSKRKMKRYGLDHLTDEEKTVLKEYLISHAADSDKPKFAGDL